VGPGISDRNEMTPGIKANRRHIGFQSDLSPDSSLSSFSLEEGVKINPRIDSDKNSAAAKSVSGWN
jgi:hypothetical protein